jgi:hypothetical protein
MDQFTQLISSQFETEENIIAKSLIERAGYELFHASDLIYAIEDKDPTHRKERNHAIKEVSCILKSNKCALRPYYVFSLLSKISGLSPGYIQRISNSENPVEMLK